MASGDILVLRPGPFGSGPVERFKVASGTTASILPGEPVSKPLGATAVAALTDAKPVVATDFMAGIAQSASNETAALVGFVDVLKLRPGVVYSIKPKTAATWDTQAKYDALVGTRTTLDLTAGSWTIDAADGATSGCVIEPANILELPGRVAFSIRGAVSYDA